MRFFALLVLCCCLAAAMGLETACLLQRKQEQEKAQNGMVGNFVPRCDADGSYSQVQCKGSTGFCWCADKDGNQLTKSVRGKPDC